MNFVSPARVLAANESTIATTGSGFIIVSPDGAACLGRCGKRNTAAQVTCLKASAGAIRSAPITGMIALITLSAVTRPIACSKVPGVTII